MRHSLVCPFSRCLAKGKTVGDCIQSASNNSKSKLCLRALWHLRCVETHYSRFFGDWEDTGGGFHRALALANCAHHLERRFLHLRRGVREGGVRVAGSVLSEQPYGERQSNHGSAGQQNPGKTQRRASARAPNRITSFQHCD